MKRDTVKTLAGLVIVGLIVLATFLYGNAQRKAQLSHDQDVKKQAASATVSPTATPKPSTKASVTPKPSTTVAPVTGGSAAAANTAPVQTPGSNNIQGNGTAKPAATPVPTVAPVAGTSNMPQTGSPLTGVVGAGAVLTAGWALLRSRRSLLASARVKARN